MDWTTLLRCTRTAVACILLPFAANALDAPATSPSSAATLARLLDPNTPSAERTQLLADATRRAEDGDANWQFIAGSLLAQSPPASPVPQDLSKALIYLSHAATQGKLLAMAEMAELEIVAGNPAEATTWAQIFAHYEPMQSKDPIAQGYTAELLARASEKLDAGHAQAIGADVAAFLARYDADVRIGMLRPDLAGFDTAPIAPPTKHHQSASASRSHSGFTDYLVAFAPDGHAVHAWPIAVTPNARLTGVAEDVAYRYRMPPVTGDAPRYAHVQMLFDDERFKVRGGRIVGG